MRLILGGILCFCCGFIGVSLNIYYIKRHKILSNGISFIEYLIGEIKFLNLKLSEIIENYCIDKKGVFLDLCKNYLELIKSGTCDKSNIEKLVNINYLKKQDKINLIMLFDNLGKSDCENQINFLSNYLQKMKLSAESSKKEQQTYGIMSYKLGILIGIALFIIVV